MRRVFTAASILLIAGLAGRPAFALTATAQFNVQITINAECQINSASDLNFGASGVLDTAVLATSAIDVQCTTGTTYNIGLNQGTGAGATVASRLMTGPGAQTVGYSLYSNAAHTTLWGNTIGTDTIAGTGSGAAQSYTVYGLVPVQTTPGPGTYNDTITVTVTY